MFCPSCGSEVAEGLRFCNRCGASLGGAAEAPPRLLLLIAILSFAVLAVTVVGLLFILILGTEMMGRRDSSANTFIFMIFLFLTVLGADWLMVRQISRLLTVYLQSGATQPARTASGSLRSPAPELTPRMPDTADLSSPPAGGGSGVLSSPPGLRRGADASSEGWSAPELTPRMPDANAVMGEAKTAVLHTTAQDTDKVPDDSIDQELPTRKL